MEDEFIAGLRAMPLWAQIGLGWFVATFIVMLVSPLLSYRRHRRCIEGLARAPGTTAWSLHEGTMAMRCVSCCAARPR